MRKTDVNELIEHATADLETINLDYKDSLNQKTISHSLRIDIKNFMENLRSALDFMAHDIYERVIAKHRADNGKDQITKISFPYGRNENDFKSRVGSSLPDLKALSQDVYDTIEAVQPHKLGSDLLYDFCIILNENKHEALSPQERHEQRSLKIELGGGAQINMPPGSSIKGTGSIRTPSGSIHLNKNLISGDSPAQNTSGNVTQTVVVWVSFKFSGTKFVVLPFLTEALALISDVRDKIYGSI